jgi:hypothetical protein
LQNKLYSAFLGVSFSAIEPKKEALIAFLALKFISVLYTISLNLKTLQPFLQKGGQS